MRYLNAALPTMVSAVGLLVAYQAWHQFEAGDYGNALIGAGTALALTLVPHLPFTREMFTKNLEGVARDAIRTSLPVKTRLVIGVCWALTISGFATVLLK